MARFLKLTHASMGQIAINVDHVIAFSPNEDGGTDLDLRDDKNMTVIEDCASLWNKLGGKSWTQSNPSLLASK